MNHTNQDRLFTVITRTLKTWVKSFFINNWLTTWLRFWVLYSSWELWGVVFTSILYSAWLKTQNLSQMSESYFKKEWGFWLTAEEIFLQSQLTFLLRAWTMNWVKLHCRFLPKLYNFYSMYHICSLIVIGEKHNFLTFT